MLNISAAEAGCSDECLVNLLYGDSGEKFPTPPLEAMISIAHPSSRMAYKPVASDIQWGDKNLPTPWVEVTSSQFS